MYSHRIGVSMYYRLDWGDVKWSFRFIFFFFWAEMRRLAETSMGSIEFGGLVGV